MIAAVSGEVISRRPDHVVVDAGGVGYRLAVSTETLRAVPAVGNRVSLHAHLIARDDSLALYGFATEEERDLFLSLISVSGVGPKVGLAALSGGTVPELLRAIATGDAKRFRPSPGSGSGPPSGSSWSCASGWRMLSRSKLSRAPPRPPARAGKLAKA